MSKISEQKALEAYPIYNCYNEQCMMQEDINLELRIGYEEGYDQAMQDFLEKACEWLSEHLFTKVVEDNPSQHYIRSVESMGNFITQTEFLEQFKNYMQDESEN